MRASTTSLAGVIAGLLLLPLGGCTSGPGHESASPGESGRATSAPEGTDESTAPPSGAAEPTTGAAEPTTGTQVVAQHFPPLPVDPHDAMVEVRRLLVEQIGLLLGDTGQRWTEARFLLQTSEEDSHAYQGYLFVTVPQRDGRDAAVVLGAAAVARGWIDAGPSHRLSIVKGPYHLTSFELDSGGQRFEITTPPLDPVGLIEGTTEVTQRQIPELAPYSAVG